MACGKVVVLTRTDGLWSHETMRDGVNVKFVPPGDLDALVLVINQLCSDGRERYQISSCARNKVTIEGNIDAFAERLGALCQHAINVESRLVT
jgi:glycosyltransferase involved in cell wall biosynthesis